MSLPVDDRIYEHVKREVTAQSRTVATGLVNASAPEKLAHIAVGSSAQKQARRNLSKAIEQLAVAKPTSPKEWTAALVSCNSALCDDISSSPGALRDFEVESLGYAPKAELSQRLNSLSGTLAGLSVPASLGALQAAFAAVHWEVNLRGHLFADGCGRTAVVVGCYIAWTWRGLLPMLPPRDQYLALGAVTSPSLFTEGLVAATKW